MSRKLDFQVGFTKKSHKIWINNYRDIRDALEMLKTGKLALWCIGVGSKAAKKRTRENDSESEASDMEETSKEMLVIQRRKKLHQRRGKAGLWN